MYYKLKTLKIIKETKNELKNNLVGFSSNFLKNKYVFIEFSFFLNKKIKNKKQN